MPFFYFGDIVRASETSIMSIASNRYFVMLLWPVANAVTNYVVDVIETILYIDILCTKTPKIRMTLNALYCLIS